jgi:hypothetical protein
MLECRLCGEYVRGEAEQKVVRCPRCREPLFERPGGPDLAEPGTLPPDRSFCALHPGNISVGACKRCGNFFCPVCRTRWREQVLCLACVERLMGTEERHPEEHAAHNRQAVLGLLCGLGAWILVALAILSLLLATSRTNQVNGVILAGLLVLLSLVPAVLGLGQSAAAIRRRGQRLIVATAGLVLSGCHIGIFVGLLLLQMTRTT